MTGIVLGRLVVPEVKANMRTSVPCPKRAPDVTIAHSFNVGLMPVIPADRHAPTEILRRANLAEVVIAAELTVGVPGDPAQQKLALHVARAAGLIVERPGQPTRAVRHRPADQPLEKT